MVVVANSPSWFLGLDSGLEILFFFIAMGIALFSLKIYRYTSHKRYFLFYLSFISMAVAFIVRSVTNLLIYSEVQKDIATAAKLSIITAIYDAGFLVYAMLMLTAYLILIALTLEIKEIRVMSLLFLLTLAAVLIGQDSYFMFYTVSAILLAYITNHFYQNALQKSSRTAWTVFSAFAALLLSQGVFMFVETNRYMYFIGHGLQTIAYLILLIAFIFIMTSKR